MSSLKLRNDNLIELDGLQNSATVSYVNTATVTLRLQLDGVDVSGVAWPVAMTYVASSNGIYRYKLASTVTLIKNRVYVATVTIDDTTSGLIGEMKQRIRAEENFVGGF